LNGRVLTFSLAVSLVYAFAGESETPGDAIVQSYCAASSQQEKALQSASIDMDVEMSASLPALKKHGRLQALRRISALGRITYERLRFEGDNTVKNQVIERYLTAETEAQKEQAQPMSVTPANYKFKYKGAGELDGRRVHIFEVSPRHKRQGLFKGQVWIDAATYLKVQESGYLVKNPSMFLKRVAFTRRYEIQDGVSVPRQVHSTVDTRLVGKAELTIDFSNVSIDTQNRAVTGEAEDQ
jgi:hypothetical protein